MGGKSLNGNPTIRGGRVWNSETQEWEWDLLDMRPRMVTSNAEDCRAKCAQVAECLGFLFDWSEKWCKFHGTLRIMTYKDHPTQNSYIKKDIAHEFGIEDDRRSEITPRGRCICAIPAVALPVAA